MNGSKFSSGTNTHAPMVLPTTVALDGPIIYVNLRDVRTRSDAATKISDRGAVVISKI